MNQNLFYKLVRDIKRELYKNDNVDLINHESPATPRPKDIEELVMDKGIVLNGFKEYFSLYDRLTIEWKLKNKDQHGAIKILTLEKVFIDGKDIVYFDHTPNDSPLRHFYIIDFFVDEACVGVYQNYPELSGMHYFEFENQTYPLYLDFEGYMKLLGETKGFLYWQKVILDYLSGSESFETKNFKETMPNLFPDFDYDAFIELYESLRIDK